MSNKKFKILVHFISDNKEEIAKQAAEGNKHAKRLMEFTKVFAITFVLNLFPIPEITKDFFTSLFAEEVDRYKESIKE